MKKNTIEPLAWDSQFFGYPIARIVLDQNGCEKLEKLFKELTSGNFHLTYFFVPPVEKEINKNVIKKGGVLVDQKTVFLKTTEKQNSFSHHISEFQGLAMNESLKKLILQSGKYSRFHIDKYFVNNEYEKLYTEWLRKSINKSIALKILVAKNGSEIVGITTLGKKKDSADIGLVAVDEKFRGQGIGNDLIRFSDNVAHDMGFPKIKVVTQLQNKSACKLYEKSGFHIESITNVYHYWQ
jgi:dTDP-4-amino-4,6-dideoxy-D-galactose acyltransferase